ncbi:hypothetical protein GCM10025789_12250 [Tessaracoccus lubricantis]|uniref:WXG100 family type VII secretion target n=1 Tax=Tessaracoccus lubricantis TaxID=545543 RepID=A0ABP9F864_9ACTN
MDYEVDFRALTRAGDKAAGLGADIAATLGGMRLDGVADAVPGGLSGAAANRVDAAWQASSAELVDALEGYAAALTATADSYRLAEERAVASAEAFFGAL